MDSTISILNFSVSFLLVGGRGNTKGEYKGGIQRGNTKGEYKGGIQRGNTKGEYKGGIHNHFTIPE